MELHTLYGLIYLEINLVAVFLVLTIRHRTRGISKMVAQRNFTMCISAEVVFFLSDTVCVLMANGLLPSGRAAVLAAKTVYFFSTTLMCFFWFVYFEHLQSSPLVESRRRVLLSSGLVWVMGLFLAVNLFTGILFYVDGAGIYHRGSLFNVLYVFSYTYVFFTCFRALLSLFKNPPEPRRRLLRSLALFPLAPAGAGILQFLYPQLPLACAALSLATLILYLNWVEEMISIDPLTRLNNRNQLAIHFPQWLQEGRDGTPLYLLFIDANRFKQINDTYGHTQGDAALVRIADALRLSCRELSRRPNIARFGGDEFVILASATDPLEIDYLCQMIESNLARLNREAGVPYPLTVSIGVTEARPGDSLKGLIVQADEHLYQEKAKFHRGS